MTPHRPWLEKSTRTAEEEGKPLLAMAISDLKFGPAFTKQGDTKERKGHPRCTGTFEGSWQAKTTKKGLTAHLYFSHHIPLLNSHSPSTVREMIRNGKVELACPSATASVLGTGETSRLPFSLETQFPVQNVCFVGKTCSVNSNPSSNEFHTSATTNSRAINSTIDSRNIAKTSVQDDLRPVSQDFPVYQNVKGKRP